MVPWAGYVRVSFVGGRQGDRFRSPRDQADALEAWARARRESIEVLDPDLDESGGTLDRPGLTAALEGIEQGRYRGLVVAYLSRASRSTRDLLAMWDRIEAAGGQLHSVGEQIDTSTPAGRLTRTMLVALAEHELDTHRDRFEQLRASATQAGVWQRRQTPVGYRRDPDTRRLVPDRDADRVRDAFAARAAGATITSLANELGMTVGGVRHMLRNRVYLGELRVGEHTNHEAHPPLIDPGLFATVQAAKPARPAKRGGEPALLAGLARCAGCGHVMSRNRTVYACQRRSSAGPCPSPAAITISRLDAHVEAVALRHLDRLRAVPDRRGQLVAARDRAARARAELAAYLDATSALGEGFATGAASRRDQVRETEADLARLLTAEPAFGDVNPRDVWANLGMRDRGHLLRGLVEAVLIRAAGRGGTPVPVPDRVRVVAAGTGLRYPTRRGEAPAGIHSLWLNRDDPTVLRMQP